MVACLVKAYNNNEVFLAIVTIYGVQRHHATKYEWGIADVGETATGVILTYLGIQAENVVIIFSHFCFCLRDDLPHIPTQGN